jgi:pimeloyl-ACP methyl ester carboxylesterase
LFAASWRILQPLRDRSSGLGEDMRSAEFWRRCRLLACVALSGTLQPNAGAFAAEPEPIGIALEGLAYPHPVAFMPVTLEGEALRMAYMDVPPTAAANGRTALLLHGRNFPASYWEPVIKALSGAGYRVVVPDQIGFGKSSKPTFAYDFDAMARTTVALLDRLNVGPVDVVAHSMGGMLGVRLARAYPDRVAKLVLQAPIGLEDYRLYVPPVETERLLTQERGLTAEGYRQQLLTNYAAKSPEAIEPFVQLRERVRGSGEYERWLRSFVNSYQMIYRQPVAHEIPLVRAPTLFIMGEKDFNAPGRPSAPPELRPKMGQNARLAQELAAKMPNGRAVVFEGIGHLVHMDAEARFNEEMLRFLAQ